MFYKTFKSNQPFTLILTIGLSLLVLAFLFVSPQPAQAISASKIGLFFTTALPSTLGILINIFIVILSLILVKRISSELSFIKESTHLPPLLYFSLCLWLITPYFSTELFSGLFILLGWQYLLRIYNQQNVLNLSFNAGLLLSIAVVFFKYNIVLLLLPFSSLLILRTPKFKEFLMAIIGIIIPFIYLTAVLFITDSFKLIDDFFSYQKQLNSNIKSLGFLLFLLISVINSLLIYRYHSKDTIRKQNISLVLYISIGLAILFATITNAMDYLVSLTVFPICLILSRMILDTKSIWIKEIITTLVVVSSIFLFLVENGLINF